MTRLYAHAGLIMKDLGTMSPYTFLRAIGPEPWNAAYVEPSRRQQMVTQAKANRLYQHHQFQSGYETFSIKRIQELYLEVIGKLGIHPLEHDIRSLGITGKTHQLVQLRSWLGSLRSDGMEITQFTYFQQVWWIGEPGR